MTLPVAVITAAISVLTVGIGGLWTFKRNNISGAAEITDAALSLVKPQSQRIQELSESVDAMTIAVKALRLQIVELETNVHALTAQIIELGHEPRIPVRPTKFKY